MNNSRREFIKTSSLMAVGAFALSSAPTLFAGKKPRTLTGIQLYSIRDEMNADPLGTLQQLAEMGYKYVEHANYRDRKFYGYSPADFKKILNDLGMEMPSGHTVLRPDHWDNFNHDFSDEWKYTVEDAAFMGQKYVISPWLDQRLRNSESQVKEFMDVFNKCGELCNTYGMKFGYHNHDFEFSQKLDGKVLYDIILDNTDPEGVIHQLDIGNMYNAGAKAPDLLKKYPGRFESIHVKDEIEIKGNEHGKFESTILGSGIINVKEVIDLAAKEGGSVHFIIEQEAYQGKKPLDCMKENIAIMKSWGY